MSVADTLKDHIVIVVLGSIVSGYTAGWASYKSVLDAQNQEPILKERKSSLEAKEKELAVLISEHSKIQQSTNKLPSGEDVLFYLNHVPSPLLWKREAYVLNKVWDQECKESAKKAIVALGFSPHQIPSDIGTRTEVEGTYLGVQCESNYSSAIVFGMSLKSDYSKLRAYGESLAAQLTVQGNAFK